MQYKDDAEYDYAGNLMHLTQREFPYLGKETDFGLYGRREVFEIDDDELNRMI